MMMEPSKSSLRFIAHQAFFAAVRSGDLESLKQIVGDRPSDVSDLMSLQTEAGETALYIAADNNLEELFSYLIKLCDFETVKIRPKSDLDAFHLAAKKGHLGMFSFPFSRCMLHYCHLVCDKFTNYVDCNIVLF